MQEAFLLSEGVQIAIGISLVEHAVGDARWIPEATATRRVLEAEEPPAPISSNTPFSVAEVGFFSRLREVIT